MRPLADPDAEQSQLLSRTVLSPEGEPPNLFKALAAHAELMRRVNGLGGLFMAHSTLDAADREFVILRTAVRTGSAYEYSQHLPVARRVGLSAELITAAGGPVTEERMPSERYRTLATLTDELLEDCDLSAATWARARSLYSDEQLLELLLLPGFYRMLAAFLQAARVPLDEGLEATQPPRMPD